MRRSMKKATGIDAILQSVDQAFEDYNSDTLDICYGHLYAIYNESLLYNGDNNFPDPHANVRSHIRNGQLELIRVVNMNE